MKKFVFLAWIFGLINEIWAQDILQKSNKAKLEVKIIEIGPDEIKYKNYNDLEGPIYVIYKRDVMSIQLENGEIIKFEKDIMEVSESPNSHKRSAIMIDPFSPLFQHVGLGYQRWIIPGMILEAKTGFIGIGLKPDRPYNYDNKKRGGYFTLGSKLMFKQFTYTNGTRLVHPLAGTYLKPQLSFSYFTYRELEYLYQPNTFVPNTVVVNYRTMSGAFNLTIGKQWLIADIILLDIFFGAGYGFADTKSTDKITYPIDYYNYPTYYHSHTIVGDRNFPMTLTSGISLGFLMK